MTRARWAVLVGVGALALALGWPPPADWFADSEHRRVLDRHGQLLAERRIPTAGHQTWVELDDIAPAVVQAVLASEDDRFHLHPGLDPLAIGRAAWTNLRAGGVVQGGSTLTQQAARLLAGRPRGWSGKAVEAWRAVRLDVHRSKADILTWYLNRASFGAGAVGIQAAARTYFDESAAGLSVAEAATLVGLLPAPEARNPWRDPASARAARDRVLSRMVATGRLSSDDAERARAEPLELRARPRGERAPHAVARLLRRPETTVRSTLDPMLQDRVASLVTEHLAALSGRGVDHAAVLVVDVATGDVRAAVGSGDWHAADGQVDGTRAPRSPGSTLKPFVYAMAFEDDLRPGEVLPDTARQYATTHGAWTPENYSERFHGPVRARVALASSLNVPAVVVADAVGVPELQRRLGALGLTHLERRPAELGLGLAIGGGEATLEELTLAYAALARGGAWLPARWSLDDAVPSPVPVFDPDAAALVLDVLSDPLARMPAFGRWGPLERRYPAAVKTGTSTGFRDNWTIGTTPSVAVGVWVGNFDGRPMGDVSGVTGAGPLWAAVMDVANDRRAVAFEPPEAVPERLCALSGLTAGPHCPHAVADRRLPHHAAPADCDWHGPDCAVAWPAEFADWAAQHRETAYAAGCPSDGPARIAAPANGAVFFVDDERPAARQRIPLRASAPSGAREAEWRVDGALVARVPAPFEHLWAPSTPGPHRVELTVDGRPAGAVHVHVGGATP